MAYDPYSPQPPSQPPGMQPPPPPGVPPAYPQQAPGIEINGKAVAALVCGLLFVATPLGLMGLFFGKTAERQIDAGMGIGRPLAKAGRVLGWVSVGFTIFWGLYIVAAIIAGIAAFTAVT